VYILPLVAYSGQYLEGMEPPYGTPDQDSLLFI
jgi:hypothetical protein